MQNPKFETVTTCKTVDRLAMTDHEYLVWWAEHSSEHRCADLSSAGVDMTKEREGYLVRYQSGTDQEYYSWSPKEIMAAAVLPPLIKIDLDALAVDPGFLETVTRVRSRLLAVQRELEKAQTATFTLPENCNDPSEIIRALATSLSVVPKTIEIDMDREIPTGLIEKMSEALYDGVCKRFGWELSMQRGKELPNKVEFFRQLVSQQLEQVVRAIVSDRGLVWTPEEIREFTNTSWDKLVEVGHMQPNPTVEFCESEVADTSVRPAEPGYSPLFEKVHAEFLRKLSVTSLPQALEAALVVYTDGLTYTEE